MPPLASPSFITPTSALDRRNLGKFEVLCRLSTGGMSEIYLAHQQGVGGFRKVVVLKTILPDIGGEEDFVRMFLEEARTTAAFAHPNIAQVFELDVDDGQLFMAMEFVQGCTLVEMARACRQAKESIPIGFTTASVRDTALALHYAHNFIDVRGRKQVVIHRDVAEKNIMVTFEGVTKLLDFGIAKAQGRANHTSVGMVKGTSGYMSPEQIRGEPLDARSDVFSLGVVLHECLTGMRLFHGKTPEDGMLAALNQQICPPSKLNPKVWAELDQVTLRALSRVRDDRFGTALEFARALEKAGKAELWLPEQSGEMVSRFFAERRQETSRLLDGLFGDTTGEVRVEAVMQRVKASSGQAGMLTAPVSSLQPPRPSVSRQPPQPAPVPEPPTNPARPRSMSPTPPVPPPKTPSASPPPAPPKAALPLPSFDDDADAKTIPASSLPEELKLLRAKYKSQRPAEKTQPALDSDQPGPAPSVPNIVVDESVTNDIGVVPGTLLRREEVEPPVSGLAKTMEEAVQPPGPPSPPTFEEEEEPQTVMSSEAERAAAFAEQSKQPGTGEAAANGLEPSFSSGEHTVQAMDRHALVSRAASQPPADDDEASRSSNTVLMVLLVLALMTLAGLSYLLWLRLNAPVQ